MKKIILIVFFCLVYSGCGNNINLTDESFFNIMNINKYGTTNIIEETKDNDYVNKNFLSFSEDLLTQFNYIEFKNEENAKQYYDNFTKIMIDSAEEQYKNNGIETKGNNYYKYTLMTSNYRVIIWTKNSILYGSTHLDNTKELDKLVEEIIK